MLVAGRGGPQGDAVGCTVETSALLPDFYGKGGQLRGSGTSPTALGICSAWVGLPFCPVSML